MQQKILFRALLILFLGVAVPSFSQQVTKKVTVSKDTVSVIGVGDVMLGSNYPSAAKLPLGDGKFLLKNVKSILTDADVTFGNLEGCFLNQGGSVKACKSGCYFFRMPDNYVNLLVDAGFNLMNIANNHNGDFGNEGRTNTVRVLKNAGLNYAGLKDVCETARFEKNGVKYGFCGFAPNNGTVKITDIAYAKSLVAALNKDCDIVIVSFHGGAEGKAFNRVPMKTELFYGENRGNVYEFAHAMVDAGADIVFGHGPHVVRATELYKDRLIAYSLGNFCTSGDFSISGISGYAPILKVFTDKEGKFLKGKIFSALQIDKTGPVLDDNNAVAKEIKRLTELDFPKTALNISSNGDITLKKQTATTYVEQEQTEYTPDLTAQDIIDYSRQFLNTPYRRGAVGPASFDCSGFTSYVFRNFGYALIHGCTSQITQGMRIKDKAELQTGDLVFFKGRNINSQNVGHVGIVVENCGGNISFIHACNRGVIIEELNKSEYYKPRYVMGLRVVPKT